MRLRDLDKPLAGAVLGLAAYGLATLYSAGQTDVPTVAATIWHRQIIWLVIGASAGTILFRVSPRLLEWATPAAISKRTRFITPQCLILRTSSNSSRM